MAENITVKVLGNSNIGVDVLGGPGRINLGINGDRGGTRDYDKLINHPYINEREVVGHKTGADYQLQDKMDALTVQEIERILYL